MSEDKSIFKLKKASKVFGGVNINDGKEWTILRRNESIDLPSFVHFHKVWCSEETPPEYDSDGNIISKPESPRTAYRVYRGFIKDDKFIVTGVTDIVRDTNHEIMMSYTNMLISFINNEYSIDSVSQIDLPPRYYANERSPIAPTSNEISKMAGSLGAALSSNPINTISTSHVIMSNIIKSIKSKI